MLNRTLVAALVTALVMSWQAFAQVPVAPPGYVAVVVSPADANASDAVAPTLPAVRPHHRWSDPLPVSLVPASIRVDRLNSGVGPLSDTVEPIDYAAGLAVTALTLDFSLRLIATSPGPVRLSLSVAWSF